jgi:hypothetical protein
MPTFFLTIFKMKKWAISKIDKFQRSFLWKGHDVGNVTRGHYLVNWQTCTRPKRQGGLGIKDLDTFGRALWLRWLWYNSDTKEKSWKNLLKVTYPIDRQFFFSSTIIHIGDGKNTPFWEAKWLQGAANKDLAPNLFKIAKFKSRTTNKELHNCNGISNLANITSPSELKEFTLLFMALALAQLSDQLDSISWKWTVDGKYTVALAYECQFLGAFQKFPSLDIWKALSEPKSKFFTWLALHDRVLMVDNMINKIGPITPCVPSVYAWMRPLLTSLLSVILSKQYGT